MIRNDDHRDLIIEVIIIIIIIGMECTEETVYIINEMPATGQTNGLCWAVASRAEV